MYSDRLFLKFNFTRISRRKSNFRKPGLFQGFLLNTKRNSTLSIYWSQLLLLWALVPFAFLMCFLFVSQLLYNYQILQYKKPCQVTTEEHLHVHNKSLKCLFLSSSCKLGNVNECLPLDCRVALWYLRRGIPSWAS